MDICSKCAKTCAQINKFIHFNISKRHEKGRFSPPVHESLFEVWLRMLGGSGWNEEDIEKRRAAWRLHIAALTPPEIEANIAAGGFDNPVLFFQTLFIYAWFSKRKPSD